MLKYVFLILLPALAFADLEANLKNFLDGNKDGVITLAEAEAYFLSADTDKDNQVSEPEFAAAVDSIDPFFVGHENTLFGLLNRDGVGHVNKNDVDNAFTLLDFNRNGDIDESELHLLVTLAKSQIG